MITLPESTGLVSGYATVILEERENEANRAFQVEVSFLQTEEIIHR